MGCFSFIRADQCIKQKNLVKGDSYKILIPKHLGGGYIKDKYWDYGYINYTHDALYYDANGKKWFIGDHIGDLYGLLAWFNCPDKTVFRGERPRNIGEIIERGWTHDDHNRRIGIDIGCYDNQVDKLKYPLKLVSIRCKDTYEECKGRSYSDPEQGFKRTYWYE